MNIEEQLKKTAQAFVEKVISGDYKLKNVGEHIVTIIIDDAYVLALWTSNDIPDFDVWNSFCAATYKNPFLHIEEGSKISAFEVLKAKVEIFADSNREFQILEEIEKLNTELNAIKKG